MVALLGAAGVLSVARAMQPAGAFWILLVGLTPLGLGLYAVVLVALGARLLVAPSGAAWAAAGVAVVGLLLHAWWFAPQVVGSRPLPAAGGDRLIVMTANLAQDDGDPAALVRLATAEHVDLLVVEEIVPDALAAMGRAGIADVLPHRLGEPRDGSAGTMVFARTDLEPVAPLATTQEGWVARTLGLTVVTAHPQAPTIPADWRADHAALLAAATSHRADLVLGDLNATADHAPRQALAAAGYHEVGTLLNRGWQPTWPSGGHWSMGVPTPPLARIDHVLVGPGVAAVDTHTVEIPGSDHRAVVAVVARVSPAP